MSSFKLIFLSFCWVTISVGYDYEKRETKDCILHIVTINPYQYSIQIVKADKYLKRQSVDDIAKYMNAEIAINGGFFDIGSNQDGKPTGTLVVNGNVYNIKNYDHALILIDKNKLSIKLANPKNYLTKSISIVSGIPMLLQQGEIEAKILTKTSDFYVNSHARTAVGLKADGTIVIVVVEHGYSRDLLAITRGEVQPLIKNKGKELAQKFSLENPSHINLNQLKEIIKSEFTLSPRGLSILELAKLMKDLGCQDAINLDGGGSSTLYINGKVVNQTIGDEDEAQGLKLVRPVSDAIIFKKLAN